MRRPIGCGRWQPCLPEHSRSLREHANRIQAVRPALRLPLSVGDAGRGAGGRSPA